MPAGIGLGNTSPLAKVHIGPGNSTPVNSVDTFIEGDMEVQGTIYVTSIAGEFAGNATTATTAANLSGSISESQVTNLTTDLAGKAAVTTSINVSSPLTGGGTLAADRTISFSSQLANVVLAGGTSGGASAPAFRSLVAADIPNITESQVTSLVSDLAAKAATATLINVTAPITGGGSLAADRTIAISAATSGAAGSMSASDKTKLDAATASNTVSTIVLRDGSGNFAAGTITASLTGTASNNALSATTISTTSPLTGGGDLSTNRTIAFSSQSQNLILAGPGSGSAAAPSFRSLVALDIPNIAESQVTSLVTDLAAKVGIYDALLVHSNRSWTVYTAASNTDAARGTALIAAFAALAAGDTLYTAGQGYAISTGTLTMLDGVTWHTNGAVITATGSALTLITVTAKTNWSIKGGLTLVGNGNGVEKAISITGQSYNFFIDGVIFLTWNGYGIDLASNTGGSYHLGGTITNCDFFGCPGTGLRTQAQAEYHTLSHLAATNCGFGFDLAGGNNRCSTLSAVQGTNGVIIRGGTNNQHSWIQGLTITHTGGYAITFTGITEGINISNLCIFSNDAVTGQMIFDNCKGVVINGGQLDCAVTFTSAPSGFNTLKNAILRVTSLFAITATAQQRKYFRVEQCINFGTNLPWVGNDPIAVGDGGTGALASAITGSIPFAGYPSNRFEYTSGFAHDPSTHATTINGPISISGASAGGNIGSMTVTAATNATVPAVIVGKADTVSPPIYPSALSPVFWFKADALNLGNGDTVSTWTDSSGNGKTATYGAGAATHPYYVQDAVNGRPAVYFTGVSNQQFVVSSFTQAQPYTLYVVFKKTTSGSADNSGSLNRVLTAAAGGGSGLIYDFRKNYNSTGVGTGVAIHAGTDQTIGLTATNWNIMEVVYNGASSSGVTNSSSGQISVTGVNAGSAGISAATFVFGAYVNGSLPFDGYVAELMMVSGAATATQKEGIRQYLSSKYNLTIVQGTGGAAAAQTVDLLQIKTADLTTKMKWDKDGTPVFPVYTTAQVAALTSPTKGALVYDDDLDTFVFYDGSTWQTLVIV